MKKEELIQLLENNEYDYYVYPHMGLVPDFMKWYWELHNALWEYLENESDQQG